MSRKIQEFFKATPKKKATELAEDSDLVPKKKIKIQANQVISEELSYNTADNDKTSKKETRKLVQCKFCDLVMSQTSALKHLKNIHPEQHKDLLECQICQQKFIRKKAFQEHMKIKHFDGKIQLFECDFCGKLKNIKEHMFKHMNVHLPTVECDICHAELKQWSIKNHMKQVHTTDRKFQCRICSKSFKSKKAQYDHEKSHDKKFQCTACMKTFPRNCKLLKHQKEYHENPGSYSCEICNKKFNQKNILQCHLKVHDRNRLKAFKCERCSFATDNKTNFNQHQKFHERQDEKYAAMKNPLKCPKCPTLSRNKNALKEHLKVVHPDEPFQCDLCGKYLKTFKTIKKHIKLLHQQKLKFVKID